MIRFEPPLRRATLIARYKRFLADVRFDDGETVTTHVPNSGAMIGLKDPGMTVWLSPAREGAKLPYTLRYVETPTSWAGVDTLMPNRLVKAALEQRALPGFSFDRFRAEAAYGVGRRVDFLLETDGEPPLYLEAKNCHSMFEPGLAEFPDCKAERSARHMDALASMVAAGARAAVVFVVQRSDCNRLTPSETYDPAFAAAARRAKAAGVAFFAFATAMDPYGARFTGSLPVLL
jgi:sugar fermentation stimulation protein A